MTMAETTTTNGKPGRKQLSQQLDRLDSIIDALAEGLPGAVTDACREGAKQAVMEALVQVLTSPDLRVLIARMNPEPVPLPAAASQAPPAPQPEPEHVKEPEKLSLWAALKSKFASARDAVAGTFGKARKRCEEAHDTVSTVAKATGEAFPVRRVLLIGLGVGLVVGIVCLVMPQTMAAAVSAVTTTATAVAVQTGSWLKRVGRRVGLLA
jgi:hypothetical protein